MKIRSVLTAASLCLSFLLLSEGAQAGLIPIGNAGFEQPAFGENEWAYATVAPIPSWTVSAPGVTAVWNPADGVYYDMIPEGQQVLGMDGASTVAQILLDTLAQDMIYTLRVEVGNRQLAGEAYSGYRIQFMAGGALIAEDNNSLFPPDREWRTSELQFITNSNTTNLGTNLEVRLTALGDGVSFDDARLEANSSPTQVPLPATLALFLTGLFALFRIAAVRNPTSTFKHWETVYSIPEICQTSSRTTIA